jgi:uncharacterized protein with HEPN domain
MPPDKDDLAYAWDMLDAARAVAGFVAGKSFDQYLADRMLRGAVERHIEIIGEAARGVSDAFRTTHREIPWTKIVAQRHILAHEYGEIEDELIWRVATVHIPELIAALEPLVPPSANRPG